jgi:uncharacterized membrane protein YkoI
MKTRLLILVAAAAILVLAAGTLAFGGGRMIWDEGHAFAPGTLDDGKDLLPHTTISLGQANATAQRAADGALGQVDLERYRGAVVYVVDVGDNEVRVDATDGTVVAVTPRD